MTSGFAPRLLTVSRSICGPNSFADPSSNAKYLPSPRTGTAVPLYPSSFVERPYPRNISSGTSGGRLEGRCALSCAVGTVAVAAPPSGACRGGGAALVLSPAGPAASGTGPADTWEVVASGGSLSAAPDGSKVLGCSAVAPLANCGSSVARSA